MPINKVSHSGAAARILTIPKVVNIAVSKFHILEGQTRQFTES